MTGFRTPSIERGCSGKANLGRAYQKQADRLSRKHGKPIGVYHCPHCGGYHGTTKIENASLYGGLLYTTPNPATLLTTHVPN